VIQDREIAGNVNISHHTFKEVGMKRFVLGLLVLVMAFSLLIQVGDQANAADKYPSKQINWYIHSSAGGGTDIFSRTVAMPLRKILKANIIISTMSGGSGARMLNYMLEQPADGYTLVSLTDSNFGTIAQGKTKATIDDLIGIARGCYDPQSFCVASNGKFKNIKDLVEFGKANPKKVKFGVAHMAGIDHITVHEFAKAAGFDPEIVPFTGGGEIIVSLMGGTIDAGVLNPSEFLGQYEAKNIFPVVFLVENRLKDFPDVPTAKELGWDVEMATTRGVAVKAGTPAPIVKKLRDSFAKAMATKIYKNYLRDNSMGPESILDGPAYEKFMQKNYRVTAQALKELGYIKKK